MTSSQSVFLRTIVWLTGMSALLGVGSYFTATHQVFLSILCSLFFIFITQGIASLIPTRKEIAERQGLN